VTHLSIDHPFRVTLDKGGIMQRSRISAAGWFASALATVTIAATVAAPATAEAESGSAKPLRAESTSSSATTLSGGAQTATSGVAKYWTAARMKAAVPLSGVAASDTEVDARVKALTELGPTGKASTTKPAAPRASGMKAVNASNTVGRVFFFNPIATANVSYGGHSCSASSLDSGSKQLVITAGHCVHGGAGGTWYQNWVFVPGYNNGAEPYGEFAAKQFRSFDSWMGSSDLTRDVGLATTWPNGLGNVVDVVGGNGLAWNWPKSLYITILGYPADPPYDGTWQQYCQGTTSDWSSRIALHCAFTGGSSGSPWFKDYDGSTGYVNGDMSTLDGAGWNASPYYDDAVKAMVDAQGNVT
jgi:V8-like Glu-specific endopeptidase